jgi:hypothetical protein
MAVKILLRCIRNHGMDIMCVIIPVLSVQCLYLNVGALRWLVSVGFVVRVWTSTPRHQILRNRILTDIFSLFFMNK